MSGIRSVTSGLVALLLIWSGVAAAGPAKAYVADEDSATVSVIDTAKLERVAVVPVGKPPHVSVVEAAGKGPHDVRVSPDGRLAFVSLREENAVAVLDTGARTVIGKIAVGPVPAQLAATPDSRFLLVANHGDREVPGQLSVIDLPTMTVSATIEVGVGAHGVAVSSDGRLAYVTNAHVGSLSIINLADRRVVGSVGTGGGPHGVGVTPERVSIGPSGLRVADPSKRHPGPGGGVPLRRVHRRVFRSALQLLRRREACRGHEADGDGRGIAPPSSSSAAWAWASSGALSPGTSSRPSSCPSSRSFPFW